MVRRLNADEAALWRKVVESVRPLAGAAIPSAVKETEPRATAPRAAPRKAVAATTPQPRAPGPGSTLDASWDRRLARGLVQPDLSLDLHGHNLSTAHDLVDRKLEEAIGRGVRLLLLITGKPPSERAGKRGAIRAAVGDWLAVSRHSGEIAAVRSAHPRHGGSGALYIILRRRRSMPRG